MRFFPIEDPYVPSRYLGIDHIDLRVPSLSRVRSFYDAFLPALGLTRRTEAFVDASGVWRAPMAGETRNVVEYSEESTEGGGVPRFFGIIEDSGMTRVRTRIAFALASADEVRAWGERLADMGARGIEFEDDFENYPAVFFEDPAGTPLELCARVRPSQGL